MRCSVSRLGCKAKAAWRALLLSGGCVADPSSLELGASKFFIQKQYNKRARPFL
jgi:hypothetical protein